ncbi:MAG: N-acetylmuramoyl-L-alanine amidase [Lachnospiraceae bacterium]
MAKKRQRRKRRIASILRKLVILSSMVVVGWILSIVVIGNISGIIGEIITLYGNDRKNEILSNTYQSDGLITNKEMELPKIEQPVTIMIDPGHGGHDPGTSTLNCVEKDITLQIARCLEMYLMDSGAQVILTRTEDTFIDKYDRAKLANENTVDLFISIHCNYLDNFSISGVETYYFEGATDSMSLANTIHKNVLENTGANDMHVRTNDFVVIRETRMPAILIETGYLSNQEEAIKLNNEEYQKKVAYGIGCGIVEFLNNK